MKLLITSLKEYLNIRRSFGYKLNDDERCLKKFISFLRENDYPYITAQSAVKWATLPQEVNRSHWSHRLSMVRLFARYRIMDDPRTEIPSAYLLSQQPSRAQPYIYSDKEIRQLLIACQSLSSRGLRQHTYYTFFGLMAVTGCRLGELVALNRDDLDIANGWLTIRNSKHNSSRLLPLHKTTILQLTKYNQIRDTYLHDSRAFFISDQGTRITIWSARTAFIQASIKIGLRKPTDSHGPRIHDIRHTFAVKTLLDWYRRGRDINQKISLLSTYLGHKKPTDTYWYITGTPELLAQATSRFEKKLGE